jgi:hypothetical protein
MIRKPGPEALKRLKSFAADCSNGTGCRMTLVPQLVQLGIPFALPAVCIPFLGPESDGDPMWAYWRRRNRVA